MDSLRIWTIVIIMYQTIICTILSWLTLSCRLSPDNSELHELTLMKLLYLYDPEACGRVHFYNFTISSQDKTVFSTVMWPKKNPIAARFRRSSSSMRVWLLLHLLWLVLGIANLTHGSRPCGFYTIQVPFALTGLAVMVTDVFFMTMFIQDVGETDTEVSILNYLNRDGKNLRWIVKVFHWHTLKDLKTSQLADTTWIALLFAFASSRGIVQWILNFWLVKDNYFFGLANYRQLHRESARRKSRFREY